MGYAMSHVSSSPPPSLVNRRSDFSSKLESKLDVETLLVTGSKASHVNAVHTMHQACNKTKVSLLKIDDVGDVITETVSTDQCHAT